MRIASQKINEKGVVLSKSRTDSTMQKYIILYNKLTERLFNLGYLTSPSYFDDSEFWKTLFDEYPDLVTEFCDCVKGTTKLTPEHISYVMKLHRNDKELKGVLQIAKEVTEANQAIQDLNKVYELVKFKKKSDLVTVKSRFTVSESVYNNGKVPLGSKYVFECYAVENEVVSVDFSFEIYKTLLKNLEITDSVTLDDTALFLGDGFTVRDECEFINMLVDGEISGNGKYNKLLTNTIEHYYQDYYTNRTTIADCLSYAQQNFISSVPNCINCVNAFRSTISDDYVPVFLDTQKVYFESDKPCKDTKDNYTEFYIGSFLTNHTTQQPIGVADRLMGLCGEFISEIDVITNNYKVTGAPITIHSVNGNIGDAVVSEYKYYPIFNVKKQVGDRLVNIYPSTGIKGLKFKDYDKVLEELEVTPYTLIDEVAGCVKKVCKTNQVGFNKLVGYLFRALLCVMCDHTLDNHESPNHVKLGYDYRWVTKEIFEDACFETECIFKNLGF